MGLGGREGGSAAALYLLDGSTLRQAGAVNGVATLGSDGTLESDQIPASIANGLTFQATWNATTNSPTLPPVSTPNAGDFWIVTTAGATALPGAAGPWTVGQSAVFNGTDWDVLETYGLALGLVVAGASAGYVLYVNGSGNLATAAPGATSGIQGYSAVLAALVANGTPGAKGLALLLTADTAAAQTALALVPGTNVQAYSSVLATLVSNGAPGVFGLARLLDANQSAARTGLALVPGTDVQAYSAVLQSIVDNGALSAFALDLLGDGNPADGRETLELGTMALLTSPYTATPLAATYTLVGGSGASIADGSGAMAGTLLITTSANPGQYVSASAPAATFTYIVCFEAVGVSGGAGSEIVAALTIKATGSDTATIRLGMYLSTGVWYAQVQRFAAVGTPGAVTYGPTGISFLGQFGSQVWFKVVQGGSNLDYYISPNGTDWSDSLLTESKTAYTTVAQVGLWTASSSGDRIRVRSVSLT